MSLTPNCVLTSEMIEALQAYAAKHGRTWKSKLNDDWYSGRSVGVLQVIRNNFGPAWLQRFKLPVALPVAPDTALLQTGLAMVFGPEWITLSDADRALIVRDCTEDNGVDDLAEYQRNIGTGNLASYARCMRVRFGR